MLCTVHGARAIDFYEIQIYSTETDPEGHLDLELHSNSTTTATGEEAKQTTGVYQVRETLEATYGITHWAEIGQYLCTVKLHDGGSQYAGARTKFHFGIPQTFDWPVQLGGNIELDYMRHAAEDQPTTLEIRPIAETHWRGWSLVGNFVFEKPFAGPGTHKGETFSPQGYLEYEELASWLTPGLEYYGDMGPLRHIPGVQHQQHFLFPCLNFLLQEHVELNMGVGFGVTNASHAVIPKMIVGYTF